MFVGYPGAASILWCHFEAASLIPVLKNYSVDLPLSSSKEFFWLKFLFELRFFKLGRFARFLNTVLASLPWCASNGVTFVLL